MTDLNPQNRAAIAWGAVVLIAAAALYRVAPHPLNVAPIGAMFLLGGIYLNRSWSAWLAPFAALLISDAVLDYRWHGSLFHWGRLIDYLGFVFIGLIGVWASRRRLAAKIAGVAVTPFVFFLVSNFGVWVAGEAGGRAMYPHDLSGLLACYAAGLPFLKGTVIGDWVFAGVGLALLETLKRRLADASPATGGLAI
jgi:hypothetical protein